MVVERVGVVENQQRADIERPQTLQQPIVRREIIVAARFFGFGPHEIHSHPAKARGGDHLDFARLRIGEMNVHSQPAIETYRIGSLRPGRWGPSRGAIVSGAISRDREREEEGEQN